MRGGSDREGCVLLNQEVHESRSAFVRECIKLKIKNYLIIIIIIIKEEEDIIFFN